jgi:hypothetical protein
VADCKCHKSAEVEAVPARIVAKLRIEKKGRGGKTVSVVDGLPRNARLPEGAMSGAEARVAPAALF